MEDGTKVDRVSLLYFRERFYRHDGYRLKDCVVIPFDKVDKLLVPVADIPPPGRFLPNKQLFLAILHQSALHFVIGPHVSDSSDPILEYTLQELFEGFCEQYHIKRTDDYQIMGGGLLQVIVHPNTYSIKISVGSQFPDLGVFNPIILRPDIARKIARAFNLDYIDFLWHETIARRSGWTYLVFRPDWSFLTKTPTAPDP